MRELFEDEYFQQNAAEVMSAISPLYKNLFTYVRSKLIERYGDRIREDGPLPAHVLGNMWAQNWEGLFDLVQPFPASRKLDVTVDIMIQGITPMRYYILKAYNYTCISLQNEQCYERMFFFFFGKKDVPNGGGIFYFARNEADAAGILEIFYI